jgi:hypothetical protein
MAKCINTELDQKGMEIVAISIFIVELVGALSSLLIVSKFLPINNKLHSLLRLSNGLAFLSITIRFFGSYLVPEMFYLLYGVQEILFWFIAGFIPLGFYFNSLKNWNFIVLICVLLLATVVGLFKLFLTENLLFIDASILSISLMAVLFLFVALVVQYTRLDKISEELLVDLTTQSADGDKNLENVAISQDPSKLRRLAMGTSAGLCIVFLFLNSARLLHLIGLVAIDIELESSQYAIQLLCIQNLCYSWKEIFVGMIIVYNIRKVEHNSDVSLLPAFKKCILFRDSCYRVLRSSILQASSRDVEERTSLLNPINPSNTTSYFIADDEQVDSYLDINFSQDQNGNYIYSFEEMLEKTSNLKVREFILKLKLLSDRKKELARLEVEKSLSTQASAAVAQQILNRSTSTRSGKKAAERARSFKPQPSRLSYQGYQERLSEPVAIYYRAASSMPSSR